MLRSFTTLGSASSSVSLSTSISLHSFDFSSLKFLRLARRFNFPFFSSPSFLFFHHGLSSSDLALLRSIFLRLGLTITHIPLRFWSNFLFLSRNSLFLSSSSFPFSHKLFHGGLLLVHSSSSFSLSPPPSLFYFSLRLHTFFSSSLLPYSDFSSLSSSFLLPFSPSSHPILPWDFLSSSSDLSFVPPVESSSRSFSHLSHSSLPSFHAWFDHDPFSLFFHFLSSHHLTFAGRFLNFFVPSSSPSFFFDSVDSLSPVGLHSILSGGSLPSSSSFSVSLFDPFFFSPFHRHFLFFF
jgi:hypothetical protein